ncbi:DNA excision repair protein ERCC-6-like isoform X2 [Tachypleus tridentatus]|uniref:DNA excision repair protein ERCC-6-like isoform X2 n=1 Tax=Tachypleus tridentatus TaxID=6853 RepID=UPI003FD6A515
MSSSTSEDLSPDRKANFNHLQKEGKELAKKGKIREAIKVTQQALEIFFSEKLAKRIEKMEKFLQEYGEADESDEMVEVGKGFYLYGELYQKLYPYQHVGLLWLWELYRKRKGGILGDDMGLGKTIQIIAFLSGMFDAQYIQSVLIVMPVSLIQTWEKEFDKWAPGIQVYAFHSSSKKERERNKLRVQKRGGVLLTSYGMLVTSWDLMARLEGREFVWDYVILDEGHKIKNPTKTTKAAHDIPSKNRLVLTGTPIQNNLRELWFLFDYVHQGALLGSHQTFKMQYETPITRAREKDATAGERRLGSEIAENLRCLIAPYFLRRTKAEVLSQKQLEDAENIDPNLLNSSASKHNSEMLSPLQRKNDFITWVFLSDLQIKLYRDFLELDRVKNLLMTKKSPLVELTVLKKICDHPRLLSHRACLQLGLSGDISEEDYESILEDERTTTMSIDGVSDDDLIEESGKLGFLLSLLNQLRKEGHRTLVFSQSRKILDIIQRILTNRQWKVIRIDGTVTSLVEREKKIQTFQEDSSFSVFLLTTQVGGVGLTLTAANRVIIYDPSWNPATDAQAVDRVYRIGQRSSVVIYRLITCGTVEEKIYRRQIFKDSITRQTTGGSKDPHRYFTRQELRELFILDNPRHSSTQLQLQEMHAHQRVTDTQLDSHIAFLYSLDIFGISDHDCMFSHENTKPEDDDDQDDGRIGEEFIKQKVEMAQQLVHIESSQVLKENTEAKRYARPLSVPLISSKKLYVPDLTTTASTSLPTDHIRPENIVGLNSNNCPDDKVNIDNSLKDQSPPKTCTEEEKEIQDISLYNSPAAKVISDFVDLTVFDKTNKRPSVEDEVLNKTLADLRIESEIYSDAERDLSEEEVFNETTDKLGHKISRKSDIYVPESDTSKDESKQESTINISQEFFVADSDNEEQEKDNSSAHPSVISVPEDISDQVEQHTDKKLTSKSDHNSFVPSLDLSLRTKVFSRIEPEGWENIPHHSFSLDNQKAKINGNSLLNQNQLSKPSKASQEMKINFNQTVTNIEPQSPSNTPSKVLFHTGSGKNYHLHPSDL